MRLLKFQHPGAGYLAPTNLTAAGRYEVGDVLVRPAGGGAVKAPRNAAGALQAYAAGDVPVGVYWPQDPNRGDFELKAGQTRKVDVLVGSVVWLPYAGAVPGDEGKRFKCADAGGAVTLAAGSTGAAGVASDLGRCMAHRTGELLIDTGDHR